MALSWQKPTHAARILYQSSEATSTGQCRNSVTCVIDKTIDSAPFPEDIINQSPRKCFVQDIAWKALSLSALLAYLVDHFLSFFSIQVINGDYSALLAQKEGS